MQFQPAECHKNMTNALRPLSLHSIQPGTSPGFSISMNSNPTTRTMTHSFKSNSYPCPLLRRRGKRRSIRALLLLPLSGLVLACASCADSDPPPPPTIPVTDTAPVGDGLKVIGFAMLGAAVVLVLGRMVR